MRQCKEMDTKSAIFAVSPLLLVPFLYFATSIPDACAGGGALQDPSTQSGPQDPSTQSGPELGQEGRVLEQPTENNTAPSEGPSRLLEPNTAFPGLGDLKVAPPDTYSCEKKPNENRGTCKSTGVLDSLELVANKGKVCGDVIKCTDKGCTCEWKQ
jgi:hypothetical protein